MPIQSARLRLRYGLPLLVSAGITSLVVGCSGNDSNDNGAPGTSGAGNTGGNVGGATAGAPVTAGTGGAVAGAPASGGSGGTGGVATGGTGTAGTANAGTAGAVAGSGGTESGGTSGTAGAGGTTAGAGGTTAGAGGTIDGGTGGGVTGGVPNGGTGGGSGSGEFKLTSPNHMDGAEFDPKYTCEGTGKFNGSLLPQLDWSGAPEGTKSFAITFIDVTLAPGQIQGYHWAIWNIPPSVMSLPEGMKEGQLPDGAEQTGDFIGPCPNFGAAGGSKTDNYEFTIYALSQESITVTQNMNVSQETKAAEMAFKSANPLATAKLTGKSDATGSF